MPVGGAGLYDRLEGCEREDGLCACLPLACLWSFAPCLRTWPLLVVCTMSREDHYAAAPSKKRQRQLVRRSSRRSPLRTTPFGVQTNSAKALVQGNACAGQGDATRRAGDEIVTADHSGSAACVIRHPLRIT